MLAIRGMTLPAKNVFLTGREEGLCAQDLQSRCNTLFDVECAAMYDEKVVILGME